MKKGGIFLGILVLVGIVAFLGSAQFGYGKGKPGAESSAGTPPSKKCACWKIVRMEVVQSKDKCYRVPVSCGKDFIFSFIVELQATPTLSLLCGDLVIDASYKTCTYESGTKPRLNLTPVLPPVGGSTWITWDGTRMQVTRVSPHQIQLFFPEYHVSCRCDGSTSVLIALRTHTMLGGEICADTKTLTVLPCLR